VSDPAWPDRAHGVFETLLVLDGAPIELDAHLERLRASVQDLFGAELPAGARALAVQAASSLVLGRLRLTVAPQGSGGFLVADAVAAAVEREILFPCWERAIALRTCVVSGGLGAHKWADRAALGSPQRGESDHCLPLVLDVGEEVLEASRANVFAVEGDMLVTPAADGRILPGVTRARAIEAACSLDIELREETLTVERLIAAGEAFLTGSVRGVEPVRSIDDAELAPPGEATSAIAAKLKQIWLANEAAHWAGAR
jgi:para-aminobenzoate synthetase / 4-amino-4-deoxychorismate lyase